MEDIKILRSAINEEMLYKNLKNGLIYTTPGALLLFYGALLFSQATLEKWGAITFLMSMFLIALGLIPYQQLKKLQLDPDEIHLFNNTFQVFKKNKEPFTLPYQKIASLKFCEMRSIYGIAIELKEKDFTSARENKTRSYYHCDLFLPFFTQRALRSMEEILKAQEKD
jgi:hypothetical protein